MVWRLAWLVINPFSWTTWDGGPLPSGGPPPAGSVARGGCSRNVDPRCAGDGAFREGDLPILLRSAPPRCARGAAAPRLRSRLAGTPSWVVRRWPTPRPGDSPSRALPWHLPAGPLRKRSAAARSAQRAVGERSKIGKSPSHDARTLAPPRFA